VTGVDRHFSVTLWALGIRNHILDYFRQLRLSPSSFAVISALTVGDKSFLDPELKAAYVNSGTMHILAVSGMHVALLFWLLQQLSRPLMLWKRGKYCGRCSYS
jgi:competence protein ComEC